MGKYKNPAKNEHKKISVLNFMFSKLDADYNQNVQHILSACAELTNADYIVYSHTNKGNIEIIGSYNIPAHFPRIFSGEGRLCRDVMKYGDSLTTVFIEEIEKTDYIHTDPAIKSLSVKSYAGHPVLVSDTVCAVLCALFTKKTSFGKNDEQVFEIFAAALSIEEKRRIAEESRKKHEERFRQMADLLPVVICETNESGIITYMNQTGLNLFGYSTSDLSQLHFLHLFDLSESGRSQEINDIINEGKKTILQEFTLCKKDGSKINTLINTAPISPDIPSGGMRCTITDITLYKTLEEKLSQARKMEAIGTLAGGIAHDFSNFLSGISGYCQLANKLSPEESRMKKYLSTALDITRKADALVKSLLDYSRPHKINPEPSNIFDSVAFVAKQLYNCPDFKDSSMKIEINCPESCFSNIDAAKFEEVLLNLGRNALHAISERKNGVVAFEVFPHEQTESENIFELKPGKYWAIKISDNGTGISPEIMSRIYEPFFTTKPVGKGSGLGLSLVHSIIKAHSGLIKVSSTLNTGTDFIIYLLQHSVSGSKSEKFLETSSVVLKSTGKKIIIADDMEEIREMVREILEEIGFQVISACNGKEAIEKYTEHRPDAIIIDVKMPIMDGISASCKIREKDPSARVLIASAYSMERNTIESAGFKHHISKPYNVEELQNKLADLLDYSSEKST